MSHWLEDEINKLKEKELKLNPTVVRQNYEQYSAVIDGFFDFLKKSFDDLTKVLDNDFKFHYRALSLQKICDHEFMEFSGINLTQKPAFLRRLRFIISDEPGKMQILLFRGKHEHPEDPWKFHEKQQFRVPFEKLDRHLADELIDWFAWKSYSPRSIR
ncbi:MAG: hypothetical protein PHD61_01235 [Bacteroidales bacterium]|nr:hypothetical protein [Lentimicrobiaceae bacterium]MDD5693916.1 hypothetical protein [Bacteroidales bacterium]